MIRSWTGSNLSCRSSCNDLNTPSLISHTIAMFMNHIMHNHIIKYYIDIFMNHMILHESHHDINPLILEFTSETRGTGDALCQSGAIKDWNWKIHEHPHVSKKHHLKSRWFGCPLCIAISKHHADSRSWSSRHRKWILFSFWWCILSRFDIQKVSKVDM